MQSDVTQVAFYYKLWGWFETHRKQALQTTVAIVVVAFAVSYYFWHRMQKEASLSQEFAKTLFAQPNGTTEFLSLATANPNTSIAPRALLLAAANLFAEGKYAEAQAQFEKITQDYDNSQFVTVALLGIASCLDVQGKTDAAITAYQNLITHYPNDVSVLQAKFGLARLFEAQNKLSQAAQLYEEVARNGGMGTLGSEAAARMHDLRAKMPATSSKGTSSAAGASAFDLKAP